MNSSNASASSKGSRRPRHIYKGGPASIDAARVRELKAQGMSPTAIAKALKIGRASVYVVRLRLVLWFAPCQPEIKDALHEVLKRL